MKEICINEPIDRRTVGRHDWDAPELAIGWKQTSAAMVVLRPPAVVLWEVRFFKKEFIGGAHRRNFVRCRNHLPEKKKRRI